ncbi:MAG: hypothetical protein K6G28_04505 [Acholeplasmatales bacterium]|nr:hypothetical protein [Acholeplasmatales bacterium]
MEKSFYNYTVKKDGSREYNQDKNFLLTYKYDIKTDYYTNYVIGPMNKSYTYKNYNLEIFKDYFKVSYDIESSKYDGSIEVFIDKDGNIRTLTQKSTYRTLDDFGKIIGTRIVNRELEAIKNPSYIVDKYKNYFE